MVELVRGIRSSIGYISGELKTFCLDFGSYEFEAMLRSEKSYDYIFNLSALKHVRSERDPYTLMRMIKVNILDTIKSVQLAKEVNASNYFCVSTDKAANPANMMGKVKELWRCFCIKKAWVSILLWLGLLTLHFQNGSLLHGFLNRLEKKQPLSAPNDITRYFIKSEEAGQLCLLSCLTGENMDIYFLNLT